MTGSFSLMTSSNHTWVWTNTKWAFCCILNFFKSRTGKKWGWGHCQDSVSIDMNKYESLLCVCVCVWPKHWSSLYVHTQATVEAMPGGGGGLQLQAQASVVTRVLTPTILHHQRQWKRRLLISNTPELQWCEQQPNLLLFTASLLSTLLSSSVSFKHSTWQTPTEGGLFQVANLSSCELLWNILLYFKMDSIFNTVTNASSLISKTVKVSIKSSPYIKISILNIWNL